MKNIEFFNEALRYFTLKGYKAHIDADFDDEGKDIQLQVDVDDLCGDASFAFFGALNDEVLGFSAIYELAELISEKDLEAFVNKYESVAKPFESILLAEDNTIHLYKKLSTDEVDTKLFTEIEEFFTKPNELVKKLNTMADIKEFLIDRIGLDYDSVDALHQAGIKRVKDLISHSYKEVAEMVDGDEELITDISKTMERLNIEYTKESK